MTKTTEPNIIIADLEGTLTHEERRLAQGSETILRGEWLQYRRGREALTQAEAAWWLGAYAQLHAREQSDDPDMWPRRPLQGDYEWATDELGELGDDAAAEMDAGYDWARML